MKPLNLAAVALALIPMISKGQETVTITSDPSDLSRPVSTIINQIRKEARLSITYEDPRYVNQSDIEDVTAEVSRGSDTEKAVGPRILVPRGHSISFVYSPGDIATLQAARKTLERMVHEYSMAGGPSFVVTQDGTRLHVQPSRVLSSSGVLVSQETILDAVISIPAANRDGGELLQAICDAVRKQTGYEIGIGPSAPGNYLSRYKSESAIEKTTAAKAIADLLDAASGRGNFDWDLYYDPADKAYMLNFAYVGPAAAPNGL
jgi:hypothetical protein